MHHTACYKFHRYTGGLQDRRANHGGAHPTVPFDPEKLNIALEKIVEGTFHHSDVEPKRAFRSHYDQRIAPKLLDPPVVRHAGSVAVFEPNRPLPPDSPHRDKRRCI